MARRCDTRFRVASSALRSVSVWEGDDGGVGSAMVMMMMMMIVGLIEMKHSDEIAVRGAVAITLFA